MKILLSKNAIKVIMMGVWSGFCMKRLGKKINLLPSQEASAYSDQMLYIFAHYKFFSTKLLLGKGNVPNKCLIWAKYPEKSKFKHPE